MSGSFIKFAETQLNLPAVEGTTQLARYDEISEVLRSQKFVQGAFMESRKTVIADTTIVIDGRKHIERRNILNQIFSENALADMRERYLIPVVEHSLKEAAAAAAHGADGKVTADLVSLAQRSVYRIAAAVCGVDGLDRPEAADRLIAQIQTIGAGITVEWSRESMPEVLRAATAAQQEFRRELFEPSRQRRIEIAEDIRVGRLDPAEAPRDVLMYAVQHSDEAWAGDDELALREVCMFIVAASQTTANSLVSFILRLEQWLDNHPGDRALMATDPNFLRNAAYESLRLTVAAPARQRIATEDVRLASGREIKKNERVALLFIPANMERDRFGDDADRFNPHRDTASTLPWGMSFGSGAHSCPGRPLVTGSRSRKKADVDGTMVTVARRLYDAGMELDPANPPVADETTLYDHYRIVPIRFSHLNQ